jgi:hypothetical protein
MNEYAPTADDLNGVSKPTAKPRGTYTAVISRARSKKDKNGLPNLGFGLSILNGKLKKQLLFENYLVLSSKGNKFALARRNSFYKAIGITEGTIPPGAPGGPDASVLDGTVVDIALEHVYENVPGEDFAVSTSSWAKSRWVTEGWKSCIDESGILTKTPSGGVITGHNGEPEPIYPKESITFYNISDDFEGLGSHLYHLGETSKNSDSTWAPETEDEEWG